MNHSSIRVEVVFAERLALGEGEEAESEVGIIFKTEGNLGKLGWGQTGGAEGEEVVPA